MEYHHTYQSPIGEVLLIADEDNLTGLWLLGSKYYSNSLKNCAAAVTPAIAKTIEWLEVYFQGVEPTFLPPIKLSGSKFQMDVWKILSAIPYGKTTTYGSVANQLAAQYDAKRMAAQAVGQAVGRNPIAIIVPCHRVVGASGALTGYAGGLEKKSFLLNLEGAHVLN